uniref:Aminomethyltransferase n=1 Tax=Rhipicephalus microplus TaxID=6941 RepID=A0A6M2CJK3_RHIMP
MRVPGCRVILRRGGLLRSFFAQQVRRASSDEALQRTALYDFHVKHGGKMVPFAGYAMPVQYSNLSLSASHLHTRRHASLFDVSHMLQSKVHGPDRVRFVESLVVSDIEGLAEDLGTLTVYTNEKGGIIDDLIVNKTKDWLYVVSNAGCRDKDLAHVKAKLADFQAAGHQATLELMDSWSLLAIQGPAAAELLQPLVDCTLASLHFMRGATVTLAGIPGCRLTRCGYTGEDGFELSVPSTEVTDLAEELLSSSKGRLQLAGLGARDSLRIEAGLCLYGQDIDEDTTPVEAGLAFTIGKRRRHLADFPGAPVILEQLKQKPSRRRVGLVATSAGPPARSECWTSF